MAGRVQSPWERHDTYELVFASFVSWDNQVGMYIEEGQVRIFEEQEEKEATWYQFYGQTPYDSPLWEALQPTQEAWGRAHYAQYQGLL